MTLALPRLARSTSIEGPASSGLPFGPADDEKYMYYGRQHRWFIWLRTFATLSAAGSLLLFSNTTVGAVVVLDSVLDLRRLHAAHALLHHPARDDIAGWITRRSRDMGTRQVYPRSTCSCPAPARNVESSQHLPPRRNMGYPGGVNVLVLDDSDRPEVASMAAEFGFTYHVRPNRGHMKKAGNLKYGFEHSAGDLIVIFDADFCPRPDFIPESAPYFDETGRRRSCSRRSSSTPTSDAVAAAVRRHRPGELLPLGSGLP